MLTVLCLLTAQLADIIIKNVLHLQIGSAVQAFLNQQPREELHMGQRTVALDKIRKVTPGSTRCLHGYAVYRAGSQFVCSARDW